MQYSVLRISDGDHYFPFLYDGSTLYCPDYNPTVFDGAKEFRFTVALDGPLGKQLTKDIAISDFLACKPFRHEGHNYRLSAHIGLAKDWLTQFVTLQALTGGVPDPEYTSVQSAYISDLTPFNISTTLTKSGVLIPCDIAALETDIRESYAYPNSAITITAQTAVLDENDMYWKNDSCEQVPEGFLFKLTGWPFSLNHQWSEDLRIVSIVHVEIVHHNDNNSKSKQWDDEAEEFKDTDDKPYRMNIDFRANPFQLTQERFAGLLYIAGAIEPTVIKKEELKSMNIDKPRFVNKTINIVAEMTSQTDSKSNIIQPVFFRTRDLANIIVHPAVTENICINLDAYKSQVERFYIKIEGTSFPEIGRTESGIIFKVQGNMLPGKIAGGVYYILNQDAELVTTGKYKYEV